VEDQTAQSEEQKQEYQASLERAWAFEELIRTKGWGFVKSFYQVKIQSFANSLLMSDKPIEEFANERHELIGIRKLLGWIDNDLKTLEDDRKKARKKK
jgi:hypothetical protein